MPGFDGTGPQGLGPRTGGGFGFCPPNVGPAPYPAVGYGFGYRGFGVGRGGWPWGGGRGRAWGGGRGGWWGGYAFAQPVPPAAFGTAAPTPYPGEAESIRQQLDFLSQQSEALRARLEELENQETRENPSETA